MPDHRGEMKEGKEGVHLSGHFVRVTTHPRLIIPNKLLRLFFLDVSLMASFNVYFASQWLIVKEYYSPPDNTREILVLICRI